MHVKNESSVGLGGGNATGNEYINEDEKHDRIVHFLVSDTLLSLPSIAFDAKRHIQIPRAMA
jgi:hypothetical protein